MSHRTLCRAKDVILVLSFLVILFLPFVDSLLSIDPSPALSENRRLVDFPSFGFGLQDVRQHPLDIRSWYEVAQLISLFPPQFTEYFNDHFGFRKLLVRGSSLMALAGFPSASDVIVGRDGWLYLGDARAVSSYLRDEPMSQVELDGWVKELKDRQRKLKERNIKYVLVLAPEKSTVYPEFMPERLIPGSSEKRLDQLATLLEENTDMHVIDARSPLLKYGDPTIFLYYRTDSHWNDVGALLVAKEIIEQLRGAFPSLTPPTLSDFDLVVKEGLGGDLAGLLALRDILHEEATYLVARSHSRAKQSATGIDQALVAPNALQQPSATEVDDRTLPRVVLFMDSFGNALLPYLSNTFSRLLILRQYSIDWAIVEKESPDIVIQVIVERQLYAPLPPESSILLR